MTLLLASMPKQFQDIAKSYIQQAISRKSASGRLFNLFVYSPHVLIKLFNFLGNNSPSSPISASSPKLLLSPQQYGQYSSLQNHVPSKLHRYLVCKDDPHIMCFFIGPRSRQTSVEVDHPISHEEVYKNLRKTTAEIQNYSFESKLDRDANSKDSGISQMGGDHLLHAPANGFNNGHAG